MESSFFVITTENFEPKLLWPLLLMLGVLCHKLLRLFESGQWWFPFLSALAKTVIGVIFFGMWNPWFATKKFKFSAGTIHGFSWLKNVFFIWISFISLLSMRCMWMLHICENCGANQLVILKINFNYFVWMICLVWVWILSLWKMTCFNSFWCQIIPFQFWVLYMFSAKYW